jgi:type I restriction enzyme S subunit
VPYKAYSDYVQSDADWLGVLPSRWQVRRLRFAALDPLKYGANEAAEFEDPELPRYIRITDVKPDGSLNSETFRSLPEEVAAPYLLEEGDVLLARSGATVGKSFQYFVSWGKAAYAGYLIRFRPDKTIIHPRYAYYYFQTECYWACIDSTLIQATIQNFSAEKYNDLKLPLPALEEQKQIADFLDHKTAQTNALIAKKEELIEKLKEQRIAIITRAVTRGLDPSVPMRDSGIEWLGQVPKHWEVGGFTKFVEHRADYRGKTPEKVNDGVFLVTAKNIKGGTIDYVASSEFVREDKYEEIMARGRPKVGDLLFTTEAPLGEVANVDREDIALAQRIIKFRGEPNKLDNYFAKYWMMGASFQGHLHSLATGSTATGIKASKLFELRCVVPPIDEQRQIVKHLDAMCRRLRETQKIIEVAIGRLAEYRTALITAATTGKIDVRHVKLKRTK